VKRLNLPLVIAIFLIAVAGVGFYSAYKKEQDQVTIMAAGSKVLVPYIAVQANQLSPVAVSKSSYISGQDLLQSDYNKLYGSNCATTCQLMIPAVPILPGQRVDVNALVGQGKANPTQAEQSFSIVLPDERVVAVSATVSGAILGVVLPGDVVDVQAAGNGSAQFVSTFAKVLCVSTSASGCKGVLAAGESPSVGNASITNGPSGGPVQILLAVAQGDADQIAGQQVTLSKNTYCAVDPFGFFVSVQSQLRCNPPADRMASDQQLRAQREKAAAQAQTSTAPTTTTPSTTATSTTSTSSTTTTTGSGGAIPTPPTTGSQNGTATTTTTSK